jgi:hypothetical protein
VRLVKVVADWPGATLVPPVSLKVDLEAVAGSKPAAPPPPPKREYGKLKPPGFRSPTGESTSWWTARATSGDVSAGFTKEEILRKPDADPRGEGGMFARLERLLRAIGA